VCFVKKINCNVIYAVCGHFYIFITGVNKFMEPSCHFIMKVRYVCDSFIGPQLIMNVETLLYTVIGPCFCNTHAGLLRHEFGIQVYFLPCHLFEVTRTESFKYATPFGECALKGRSKCP